MVIAALLAAFIDKSSISILYGDNFVNWKENIYFALGCVDLDLVLHIDEPSILMESSNALEKTNYERWKRSNRLSLMLITSCMSMSIKGSIPQWFKAKDFLKVVDE